MAGCEFESLTSILDFGCGCGRVIRHLRTRGKLVIGSDIDSEAIAWCNENLSTIAKFDPNDPSPPLPYADASFDLIYAISVFTHLPEELAMPWLRELNRILRPGGLLVTSVLGGDTLFALMPDDKNAREEFSESGFYYTQRFTTDGLPEFYGLAFHDRSYIERKWTSCFSIAVYHPRAINNDQYGIVLRSLVAKDN